MKKRQTLCSLILLIMRFTGIQILLLTVFSGAVTATPSDLFGQTVLDEVISINAEEKKIKHVLSEIEKSVPIKFTYNPQTIAIDQRISFHYHDQKLSDILAGIFDPLHIQYQLSGEYIILRKRLASDSSTQTEVRDLPSVAVIVTGTVTDENGAPIPGVNVVVKGTTLGTTTNAEGKYSISLAEGTETLIFSFIGYKTAELSPGNSTVFDVTQESDVTSLGEVVVIGYGTQNKAEITSSVASIKSENFNKGNVTDAGQLIQGKVAGLTISVPSGDPTSSSQILLRGNTTLLGANVSPLILVDGVPGDLRTVAPEDIESIDVLKDGSAAAIYGTRGTNGVILITTKRANGVDVARVDYSASFSTQNIYRKLDMLTADDYRRQIAEGSRTASADLGATTDWLDEKK